MIKSPPPLSLSRPRERERVSVLFGRGREKNRQRALIILRFESACTVGTYQENSKERHDGAPLTAVQQCITMGGPIPSYDHGNRQMEFNTYTVLPCVLTCRYVKRDESAYLGYRISHLRYVRAA